MPFWVSDQSWGQWPEKHAAHPGVPTPHRARCPLDATRTPMATTRPPPLSRLPASPRVGSVVSRQQLSHGGEMLQCRQHRCDISAHGLEKGSTVFPDATTKHSFCFPKAFFPKHFPQSIFIVEALSPVSVRSSEDSWESTVEEGLPGSSSPSSLSPRARSSFTGPLRPAPCSHRRLVGGLASENVRWAESVENFKSQGITLCGDVLLISAFVSYVGYFTKKYRNELMDKFWIPYINKLKVRGMVTFVPWEIWGGPQQGRPSPISPSLLRLRLRPLRV